MTYHAFQVLRITRSFIRSIFGIRHHGSIKILLVITVLLFLNQFQCYSQQKNKSILILPRGFVFEPLILDPIQCQTGGSILKLFKSEKQDGKVYIPVNLGFQQTFIRYRKINGPVVELGMGAASFTQFEFVNHNPDAFRGQIINSDFKAAGFVNILCKLFSFRLQLFHESSHLSDYYILNNNITSPNDGTRSYEQLDLTGSLQSGIMKGGRFIFKESNGSNGYPFSCW